MMKKHHLLLCPTKEFISFGCGKGGKYNFYSRHSSSNISEALRYVAAKYNIEIIEKTLSPSNKKISAKSLSLQPILLMNIFKIYFGEQKKEKQLD